MYCCVTSALDDWIPFSYRCEVPSVSDLMARCEVHQGLPRGRIVNVLVQVIFEGKNRSVMAMEDTDD